MSYVTVCPSVSTRGGRHTSGYGVTVAPAGPVKG
jgi:hypothetical protein